jgi:hypothetical protein
VVIEPTELRERLHRLAECSAPPVRDGDDLVRTVADRLRARRRQERALAVVAAVIAVVFVAVPLVLARTAQDPGPAGPAHSSGVYTTPTRGNVSDQLDFVEGVRRLSWTNGPAGEDVPEPPLDTRHVVWAGDVSGKRWVLVAGADPGQPLPPDEDGDGRRDLDQLDDVVIAWFSGPAEGIAEEMSLSSVPRVVAADEPTALSNSANGAAVIVGAPGDRIETSGLVWVEPDGTLYREYELQGAPEGVAVTSPWPLEASVDRSVRYRVTRDGTVFEGLADAYPTPDFVPPDVELARLRPAPVPAPGDAAVAAAIDDLISRTGVFARVLSFTVVWAGDLPTRDGGSARLTLLAAEFTDEGHTDGGGLYVTAALGHDAGGGNVETTFCGSEIRPAGPPLDEMVFVVRCDATTKAPTDTLVVVAPSTGFPAARTVVGSRGIDEVQLTDGVGVLPVPADPFEVEVLDASGGGSRYDPMGTADLSGD